MRGPRVPGRPGTGGLIPFEPSHAGGPNAGGRLWPLTGGDVSASWFGSAGISVRQVTAAGVPRFLSAVVGQVPR
jgi:hypothetical protein